MGISKFKFSPMVFPIFRPLCASVHGLHTVASLNLLSKENRPFNSSVKDKNKGKNKFEKFAWL